jgi:transcriptional regulator with XRE-family HTH domain
MALAQKILARCGLSRAQLARDTGLNESTIWAWVKGKRAPGPDSLLKLAEGLERRGGELVKLAEQLRKEAGG